MSTSYINACIRQVQLVKCLGILDDIWSLFCLHNVHWTLPIEVLWSSESLKTRDEVRSPFSKLSHVLPVWIWWAQDLPVWIRWAHVLPVRI